MLEVEAMREDWMENDGRVGTTRGGDAFPKDL